MKSFSVIGLLLINAITFTEYSQAVTLRSHKDDIDADDKDIDDGPFKNEKDVQVFQQAFVNGGQSVKSIQNEQKKEQDAIKDKEAAQNQMGDVPLPNIAKNLAQRQGVDTTPVNQVLNKDNSDVSQQAKASMAKQKSSFVISSNNMPEKEKENTQDWAKAKLSDNVAPSDSEVETDSKINMSDKNAVFHQIVANAQQAVDNEANPKPYKKTEADFHQDRLNASEEIDQSAIDLEKMQFNGKDVNAFASMTQEQSQKKFDARA